MTTFLHGVNVLEEFNWMYKNNTFMSIQEKYNDVKQQTETICQAIAKKHGFSYDEVIDHVCVNRGEDEDKALEYDEIKEEEK